MRIGSKVEDVHGTQAVVERVEGEPSDLNVLVRLGSGRSLWVPADMLVDRGDGVSLTPLELTGTTARERVERVMSAESQEPPRASSGGGQPEVQSSMSTAAADGLLRLARSFQDLLHW